MNAFSPVGRLMHLSRCRMCTIGRRMVYVWGGGWALNVLSSASLGEAAAWHPEVCRLLPRDAGKPSGVMRVSGGPKILLLQSYKIIFISPNFAWLKLAKIHQETALKLLKILNLGNYILFDPLLLTPRPCRGGAGVGSAFLPAHNIFHALLSSFISLTPPLSPPLQGRGNIAYGFFGNTISFIGSNSI